MKPVKKRLKDQQVLMKDKHKLDQTQKKEQKQRYHEKQKKILQKN
jgi:hypothetical protein